ncbi:hypothetical protein Tco_0156528 [Tanacetum coccineum]
MTKLTQKGVKFDWGDKQEAAFQLLKQKLCSAPILALPEGSEDFIAYILRCHQKKGFGRCLRLKHGNQRTSKGEGCRSNVGLDSKEHEKLRTEKIEPRTDEPRA